MYYGRKLSRKNGNNGIKGLKFGFFAKKLKKSYGPGRILNVKQEYCYKDIVMALNQAFCL
ncbi:hypothetical protein DJ90_6191 [Paenibacillus macerans]|uniref:Uncharacterized protein n=1 Tax=Paenibacillus macerans TaxID=44252 RepID=A0A090XJZ7_PAEMA|nr:hypothetical protein DJ90_6191 [Paenibacillus macerans]